MALVVGAPDMHPGCPDRRSWRIVLARDEPWKCQKSRSELGKPLVASVHDRCGEVQL